MTQSNYKLNIDFDTGEILYHSSAGHGKAIRVAYKDLNKNPELLDIFSGRDGYFIGTLYASKALGRLSISNENKKYSYFILFAILFVTTMFISNILSTKLVSFYSITITGALLVYPFSYIFDYIITDVYGYQNARRVLLSTILSLILFNVSIYLLLIMPPSPFWPYQEHLYPIFGRMLRTFIASTVAFSVSFFMSSYILQKKKVKNNGGSLFKRVFSSLLISEITDTMLFCLISFTGIWPLNNMAKFMLISYFTKVSYEIAVYNFITKPLINFIKKVEKLDIVDHNTNFTPFSWEVNYEDRNNIFRSS